MPIITLNIDNTLKTPVYTQIYKYIRQEIENGRLKCGDKIPSTRSLSNHLSVSRNTIDMAYGQLMDEGYIESSPKRGYFVCDVSTNLLSIKPLMSSPVVSEQPNIHYDYEFSPYGVDLENFPLNIWRKSMRDILYDDRNLELFASGNKQGDFEFREAIAAYLHQSRGVNCSPEQIIVGAGIDYLLLLLSQLLGNDSIFAMENPSYMQAWRILTHLGKTIEAIELDKFGMRIDQLRQSHANIAYVTPSHHFPMGTIMPIKRRQEILAWAYEKDNRYIIEDDYDSEFRYKGRPIPSLQGIDTLQKVIYLGTFTKAIAPSIRIAYMILPQSLLTKYKEHLSFYSNTVPRTEQRQLTQFMNGGHFERHLNRMRNIYKAKRDYILHVLEPYEDQIEIYGMDSGLHMLIFFKNQISEKELIRKATELKLHIIPLSTYCIAPLADQRHKSTIILGYARLSLSQLEKAMESFINCYLK